MTTAAKTPRTKKAARKPSALALARKLESATRLANGGDLDGARELLATVLEADPRNVPALDLAGFVLFGLGQFEQAEECCERSLKVNPRNSYAMKGWGLCVAKQGRVAQGLASLRRAIALESEWLDPYWDFVIVCGEHGRKREAREMLRRARARFPDQIGELRELAKSLGLD